MKTKFYVTLLLTLSTQCYEASHRSGFIHPLSRQPSCAEMANDSFTAEKLPTPTHEAPPPSSPLTPLHPNNGERIIRQDSFSSLLSSPTEQNNELNTQRDPLIVEINNFINLSDPLMINEDTSRSSHVILSMIVINKELKARGFTLADLQKEYLHKVLADQQYCDQYMPQILKEVLRLYDPEEGFWFSILTATSQELMPYLKMACKG